VRITPTPLTAGLAGLFAGIVAPMAWSRFGGSGADASLGLVLATLLVVALPAHAFVVGFGRTGRTPAGGLDTGLLVRVGVWLAVAVGATLLREIVTG
jgi:hypothetical protein